MDKIKPMLRVMPLTVSATGTSRNFSIKVDANPRFPLLQKIVTVEIKGTEGYENPTPFIGKSVYAVPKNKVCAFVLRLLKAFGYNIPRLQLISITHTAVESPEEILYGT